MAQTQYLSSGRAAQSAATAGKPATVAQLVSYLIFTVSFGFTVAMVIGLIH
ncbi:hypothetical protein PV773_03970 [Mesorhizobium sp. CC13]|uniref:hypothetical protein n=1 Tax=Mesorhizobium sp. CC13 TaxID=3029194 RepID=UPI0032650A6F